MVTKFSTVAILLMSGAHIAPAQAQVFELAPSGEFVEISKPVWQPNGPQTAPVALQTPAPSATRTNSTASEGPVLLQPIRMVAQAAAPRTSYTPAYAGATDVRPLATFAQGPQAASYVRQSIQAAAKRYGLNPALLDALAWQESRYNHKARSSAGAMGVMQLMPGTARDLGVNPYDMQQNIAGGAAYLRQQLIRFDNNVPLALAAYNAGPGAVIKYDGIPPYRETQNYVRQILRRLSGMSAPVQLTTAE
jgi:soluble lytic murein transglycosylase-like protein